MDRRTFVATAASGILGVVACDSRTTAPPVVRGPRLASRPHAPSTIASPGLQALGLASSPPDGRLFVPTQHSADEPLPLIVLLHGAGGSSADWFGSYDERGEAGRYLLLAPDSRFRTWDLMSGDYGVDADFLDSALASVFNRCAVDPDRIAIAGFSDGASYSLGVGLANGDLFRSVIAYSPGFLPDSARVGKPGIFVSHGTSDEIIPIDAASRHLVPVLRSEGYEVDYHEFDGGHQVPPAISDAALEWLEGTFTTGSE